MRGRGSLYIFAEGSEACVGLAGVEFGKIRNSVPSDTICIHKDGATEAQTNFPLISFAPIFKEISSGVRFPR
jgi:hypothetical protein